MFLQSVANIYMYMNHAGLYYNCYFLMYKKHIRIKRQQTPQNKKYCVY